MSVHFLARSIEQTLYYRRDFSRRKQAEYLFRLANEQTAGMIEIEVRLTTARRRQQIFQMKRGSLKCLVHPAEFTPASGALLDSADQFGIPSSEE
jgi:hypothetical protein